jgi:PhnB protein
MFFSSKNCCYLKRYATFPQINFMTATIPSEYNGLMPYLIIKDAAGFSAFAQTVFEASETRRAMRDENTIAHAEVTINGCTIMFAEASGDFAPQPAGLFVYVDDADARYQKALDNGASSVMPPFDMPYGRSCGVLDAHGNTWWITKAP